ncbi:MAG TPA: HD domain-containing phosphohydrolase [Syntrophomonadaceae bacterium]|nr:HD domain-containing phosphohydrolase [Syntrophomonadaceae bacterium]
MEPTIKMVHSLAAILDGIEKFAIVIHCTDGCIVYANPMAKRGLGIKDGDENQFNLYQLAGCDDNILETISTQYRKTGRAVFDLERPNRDGTIGYYKVHSSLLNASQANLFMSISEDLTEKRNQEKDLLAQNNWLMTLFDNAPDAYYLSDIYGNFSDGNRKAEQLSGYKKEELIGKSFVKMGLLPLSQIPKAMALLAKNAMGLGTGPDEFTIVNKQQKKIPLEISTFIVEKDNKKMVLAIARDISERRKIAELKRKHQGELERKVRERTEQLQELNAQLEEEISEKMRVESRLREQQQQLQTVLDSILAGVVVVDRETHVILQTNRVANDLIGLGENEIVGRVCHDFICVNERGRCPITDQHHMVDFNERVLLNSDRRQLPIIKTVVQSSINGKDCLIESFIDISKQKASEEKIKYLSDHDTLTGLTNRAYFHRVYENEDALTGLRVGILFCDIDGLGSINNSLGYANGDSVVKSVAEILREQVPEAEIISRTGDDEFLVLLKNASPEHLILAKTRVLETLELFNENNLITISLSIGYSSGVITPRNDVMSLYKQAEKAMQKEKLLHRQSAQSAIVSTLANALRERDFITGGHADRMQELVVDLAKEAGVNEQQTPSLRLFAQFHDIGKIGVPDYILNKPGPLDEEEREAMRQHSEIGYRIARTAGPLSEISDWILMHHEWWDGNGYPLGLSGNNIPIECRILAIVDAFDAMTQDRPYRRAMSFEETIVELKRHAGSQFDPHLLNVFIKMLFPHAN